MKGYARSLETDNELILRCKRGDTKAFGILVTRYMRQAYFIALSYVGSHDEALDVSQEAFVRVWRNMNRFDATKEFFPWYYTILRNMCLNAKRRITSHAVPLSRLHNNGESKEPPFAARADDTLEQIDRASVIHKVFGQADERDREIILLKDVHGYSYREIAALLDIPVGTVMSRLHTARSRIRELLEEAGYEHI
jgi:RNA polymerase sigma-70 factor, ECF subfamily